MQRQGQNRFAQFAPPPEPGTAPMRQAEQKPKAKEVKKVVVKPKNPQPADDG